MKSSTKHLAQKKAKQPWLVHANDLALNPEGMGSSTKEWSHQIKANHTHQEEGLERRFLVE
ncbi:hypothetical protein, partial [Vibrio anguillarum]|uniref:hypothetical protein n=1 Tax=Vibrio anguillarum TaxID=55601 RepID=UPI001BE4664D